MAGREAIYGAEIYQEMGSTATWHSYAYKHATHICPADQLVKTVDKTRNFRIKKQGGKKKIKKFLSRWWSQIYPF